MSMVSVARLLGRVSTEPGRVRDAYRCGACLEYFEAYAWSMSGCGKKCPCCGRVNIAVARRAPLEVKAKTAAESAKDTANQSETEA